jgi:hypothetical protein
MAAANGSVDLEKKRPPPKAPAGTAPAAPLGQSGQSGALRGRAASDLPKVQLDTPPPPENPQDAPPVSPKHKPKAPSTPNPRDKKGSLRGPPKELDSKPEENPLTKSTTDIKAAAASAEKDKLEKEKQEKEKQEKEKMDKSSKRSSKKGGWLQNITSTLSLLRLSSSRRSYVSLTFLRVFCWC